MRVSWLGAITICLCLAAAQGSSQPAKHTVACKVCNGYHVCGYLGHSFPDCINGVPCTRLQYHFCEQMLHDDKKCDRPGIFADVKSPNKYVKCSLDKSLENYVSKKVTCPARKVFNPTTLNCLSKREEQILAHSLLNFKGTSLRRGSSTCKKAGTFGDPLDCKRYRVCDSGLVPHDYYCPKGTYFSNKIHKCHTNITNSCKEKLQNLFKDQVSQANAIYRRVVKFKNNETKSASKYKKRSKGSDSSNKTLGVKYSVFGLSAGGGKGRTKLPISPRDATQRKVSIVNEILKRLASNFKLDGKNKKANLKNLQNLISKEAKKVFKDKQISAMTIPTSACNESGKFTIITLIIIVISCECPICPTPTPCPYPTTKTTTPHTHTTPPYTTINFTTPHHKTSYSTINYTTPTTKRTPSTKFTIPTTRFTTPSTKHTIPTTKFTTPSTKTTIPTTRFTTPSTKHTIPTTRFTTPSTKHTIPTTRFTTPSTKHTIPTTRFTTPSTKHTIPTTKFTTPSTKHTIPTTRFTTPSTKHTIPTTRFTTPSTKHTIPTTRFTTPSTKHTIPTTKFTTPATKPTKKPKTTTSTTTTTTTTTQRPRPKPRPRPRPRRRFKCPYVGYFRDPYNCHKFYRCKRKPCRRRCFKCLFGRRRRWCLYHTHHRCRHGKYFSNFFWQCVRAKPMGC